MLRHLEFILQILIQEQMLLYVKLQVVKDTDDVTNADFLREVCFCNNNFHIFATTESATLPVEQRTRAELLFYNALCVRHTPTLH